MPLPKIFATAPALPREDFSDITPPILVVMTTASIIEAIASGVSNRNNINQVAHALICEPGLPQAVGKRMRAIANFTDALSRLFPRGMMEQIVSSLGWDDASYYYLRDSVSAEPSILADYIKAVIFKKIPNPGTPTEWKNFIGIVNLLKNENSGFNNLLCVSHSSRLFNDSVDASSKVSEPIARRTRSQGV